MQQPEIDAPGPPRTAMRRHIGGGLLLISIGMALGIAVERSIITIKADPETVSRPGPVFTRVGDRIVVPDGSPLRTRLSVAAVEMTQVSHKLVLPAVVEADPARTVKVLTPVTGRLTDLKVQLGARVAPHPSRYLR